MEIIKLRYWNGSRILKQESFINHLNKYIARNDKNLMLFSGIYDKNKVEIYEKDILKGRNGHNYLVVFENTEFVCYHTKKELGRWGRLSRLLDTDMKELLKVIEVIGNEFENPELLIN